MTAPPTSLLELLRRDLAGQYRIDDELGSGATATVYRAFDVKHARSVAIKLLRPELSASLTAERFMREINFAAQLQHPHILPMLDSGRAAGSYYFVMPLVEGETLRERLRRAPPLAVGEAVRILLDLADALNYAHRHGVVHRDIKPDNIMLTGRHAVVMDFGVAKAVNQPEGGAHLTSGVAIGTPAYMAPEQATAGPTDHRADLYALGIVGYEMLTGRPPFIGATPQEVLTAQVVLTPEPIRSRRADVPGPVAETIEHCLAKQPEQRWQTAGEVLDRLDSFATPSGGLTPAALRRPRRRIVPLAVGIAAVAGAALLWDLRLRSQADAVAPAAQAERLSFLGIVREAAPSPDGSLLAYITADTTGQALWVQDAAGVGRPIELARSERIVGVAWTSGGADLSYTDGPAERPVVRMVPRLGGPATVAGTGRGILSPDAKRLLVATGSDPTLLVISRADGDTLRLKRPGAGWMSGVAWAPTSDRLAATILAPDKDGAVTVTLGLDGSVDTVWTDRRQLYGPAWSPDAKAIYLFASNRTGKDLLRLDLKGKRSVPVAQGLTVVDESRRQPTGTFLSVTATGNRAVFVEEEQWSNLARFVIDGRVPQRPAPILFTMGTALYTSARLSPDGRTLAVYLSTPRGITIGTVPIDGNEVSEIGVVDDAGEIAWAPDGMAIAYTGSMAEGGVRLSIYERGTGSTRRSQMPVGMEISWGATGIVAQQPGNHGLLLIDPSTLTSRVLPLADSMVTTFVPRVRMDGSVIAMLSYQGATGPVSLSRFDQDTRRFVPVLAGAYRPLRWSANGETLYAVRNSFAPAPEAIVAITLDRPKPRVVAMLPPGYVTEDLTQDGRLLIATQLQSRSEAYQLALPKQ